MKKRNKSSRFILKNSKESWKYLKESKNFIYGIIAVFFVFALIGFFIPAPEAISEQINKIVQDILEKTRGMSADELVSFIFFNNLKSSFFGLIFGIALGVFPVVSAISNGYLLGFVSSMSVKSNGIASLWRLLPHGIFELPAVFISLGLGLRLGMYLFNKKRKDFKDELLDSLKVFIFIVIPLLIIAAIIEGILIAFFR